MTDPADTPLGTYPVADGVVRAPTLFVNAYFVGDPEGPWVLVDTGLPNAAGWIERAAAVRFGADAPPEAIILTHGHFDHAGNAAALAQTWDVPVYAHDAELPFLTGQSDYPPKDPTPGGAIAFMGRFFPTSGYDLRPRVRPLPPDGSVPGAPGWRWVHTPGHTPGHVSLFRDGDRTLLAGDAVATMDLDSWTSQVTHARELARPPVPFTPDWDAAHVSVGTLARLQPAVLAAGHGRALSGPDTAARLQAYATKTHRPDHGRYVKEPAQFDPEEGVVAVPPPVKDPLPLKVGLGMAAAATALFLLRRRGS